MGNVRRSRRRNRRKNVIIIFLLMIVFILIGSIAVILLKQYRDSKKPSIQYVSMTEEASAKAFIWLNKIEDTGLTYEDVKNCMGDFNLEVIKTPTSEKGVYELSIADGAYEYCSNQAKIGIEKAYKLALCKRIAATGYSETISDELVERLMNETFGMSVSEYIDKCGITLLPSKQELEQKYSGEVRDEK